VPHHARQEETWNDHGPANAHPEVLADKTVGQVADHMQSVIGGLKRKPAVVGHSFGGLLAQILAGRGCSAVTVAVDPAPFRGVCRFRFLRFARRSRCSEIRRTVIARCHSRSNSFVMPSRMQ